MFTKNYLQSATRLLISALVTIGLMISLASCSDRLVVNSDSPISNVAPSQPIEKISEVSPPEVIQELSSVLESYQPQVKIINPQPDQIIEDTNIVVRLDVKDLPLFKDPNLGLGPHLHVILDQEPEQKVYDLNEPLTFNDLSPGTHTLRVFAVRPWDESFKNEGAYAQTTFHIFTKTSDHNPDPALPLLTYNQPAGKYGAEPILLDFYLTNAPLHLVAQQNSDDQIADWRIRVTINDKTFFLDRWEPIYLKGFKPGSNWIHLEFLDEKGTSIKNIFNDTVKLITYEPDEKGPLSRIFQGEISAADARGIVDPNYTSKIPASSPTITPTPAELTPTVEEPTPVESTPTVEESTPTSTGEEPTPVESTPTSTGEEPTPVESTPTSTGEELTPTPTGEEPTPVESTPTSTGEELTPTPTVEEPTTVESTPTVEEPTPVESTPTVEESTPVESTPTIEVEEPTTVESTPTGEEPTPVELTPTVEEPTPVELTPTVEEPTPVESTSTPTVEEPTPVESTSTPTVEEPTPVESTSTPTVEEPTPVESTSTPTVEEPTPVELTSTPTVEEITSTPTVEEPTPVESTSTPTVEEPTTVESLSQPQAQKAEKNKFGQLFSWFQDRFSGQLKPFSTSSPKLQEVTKETVPSSVVPALDSSQNNEEATPTISKEVESAP